ncbi:hypothetical protein [Gymnodinialimonas hymeniacidonis]|uniref:hypothetical protein n=1 Tax=Gymnodinialimonas hymeniacidonis TaxID=3126508 RepID=UPI0034C5D51B
MRLAKARFAVAFLLALGLSVPVSAQQTPWSLSVRSEVLTDEISGVVNDFGDETVDTIWASPTVFILDGIARPCEAYDYFEVNFFGGRGAPGWDLNVIFEVQRTGTGWAVSNPGVFFNEVNRDAAPVRSWEAFDNVRIAVSNIECTPQGRMRVQMEFAVPLVGTRGQPSFEMRGVARGEYDIELD